MDKHNFEKDINVPSKQRIMDDYNAKDCEQCSSDSVCCYCKNIACYKLEEQLKAKEQECERLKINNTQFIKDNEFLAKRNSKLKAENDELKGIRDRNFLHALEEQKRADKYFKTLTEIKEIAEANKKYIYVLPSYFVAGDSLEFSFEFTKNILNKISECEVEND